MRPVPRPQYLGRLGYRWAWRLQHLRREAVIAGVAPEAIWLLEHDPVVTTGRRPVQGLPTHVDVVRTERGGLATWHGPGQLVGYLILDIGARGGTVKGTVLAMERGVLSWLDAQGVRGARRPGYPGVWIGNDKVCALGVHVRRGVTMHGFALNLKPDLHGFSAIVPCGITSGGVTSLLRVTGRSPTPAEAASSVGVHLVDTLADLG